MPRLASRFTLAPIFTGSGLRFVDPGRAATPCSLATAGAAQRPWRPCLPWPKRPNSNRGPPPARSFPYRRAGLIHTDSRLPPAVYVRAVNPSAADERARARPGVPGRRRHGRRAPPCSRSSLMRGSTDCAGLGDERNDAADLREPTVRDASIRSAGRRNRRGTHASAEAPISSSGLRRLSK
jgi:hypothetical protein